MMGFLLGFLALTLPLLGLARPNSHSLLHSLGKRVLTPDNTCGGHNGHTCDPSSLNGAVVAQVQVGAGTPMHIVALAASRPTPPADALVDQRPPAQVVPAMLWRMSARSPTRLCGTLQVSICYPLA